MNPSFSELEAVYERLAEAIDQAGTDKAEVMLAKVVLLLANRLDHPAEAIAAIETALKDL